MVSLPQCFVASPSAVRNHRLACQHACHSASVSLTSTWSRRWRSLASLWPPGTPTREQNSAGPQPWPTRPPDAAADVAWRIALPGLRNRGHGPACLQRERQASCGWSERRDAARVGGWPNWSVPAATGHWMCGLSSLPNGLKIGSSLRACAPSSGRRSVPADIARQDRGQRVDRDARPLPEARLRRRGLAAVAFAPGHLLASEPRTDRQSNACSGTYQDRATRREIRPHLDVVTSAD